MAILHVRNVPDDLMERIRQRARENRRSLSAEVVTILERGIEYNRRSVAETLERMERRRLSRPRIEGVPDSVQLLREGREERGW